MWSKMLAVKGIDSFAGICMEHINGLPYASSARTVAALKYEGYCCLECLHSDGVRRSEFDA